MQFVDYLLQKFIILNILLILDFFIIDYINGNKKVIYNQ